MPEKITDGYDQNACEKRHHKKWAGLQPAQLPVQWRRFYHHIRIAKVFETVK
jgi:hypothetical protein